ncbi:MAG TPA: hypothetical protein VGB04_11800 [Allosphingosinicella sp.]
MGYSSEILQDPHLSGRKKEGGEAQACRRDDGGAEDDGAATPALAVSGLLMLSPIIVILAIGGLMALSKR